MRLVSYVVTLYNKRNFLPYLLAGLARQEGDFRREMIFVDDGSTDDTVPLLRAMTAGWANVTIIEQANAGPAAATNAGLARCAGDFIKPVDGDDMLAPWATAYLLEAIETTGRSVAFGDMRKMRRYQPGQDVPEAVLTTPATPLRAHAETGSLRLSLHSARTNPTAWLARAETVRAAGGSDFGVFIQDYSFELRLAAAADFVMLDNTIFFAPQEAPDRLSGNEAQILHDVNLAVMRFLRQHPELPPELRRYGMRRVSGRAWSWAARHGGLGVRAGALAGRLRALAGLLGPDERGEAIVCAPFRATNPIRLSLRPPVTAEQAHPFPSPSPAA
ncbi:glycosyltransferase [Acidocella sp. KAb 2-4]|uniref:glycosyltransferase family 2 protein n=1 Tax=Acidocella sp. KAb 2-4 TaxID=2885158 RepID=UPI001D0689B2|nr:glycosyltransferase [Acidocella sp. KAb 2-4]MCB5943965.1 glycosyltransferase [Acidocella sp. KAb 2-4]